MTEEQKDNRIHELVRELRELAGARAIVWWIPEDVLSIAHCLYEEAESYTMDWANEWLENNAQTLQDLMTETASDYITNNIPEHDVEEA